MPTLKSKNKLKTLDLLPVGITMGDPGGIGPEIIAKSLRHKANLNQGPFCLIGDREIFMHYLRHLPESTSLLHCENPLKKTYEVGKISSINGAGALTFLNTGIKLLKKKYLRALVTAPLAKEAVKPHNKKFQGHTEHLAEAFSKKQVGMLFVSDHLKTIIVTRHLPLRAVPRAITLDSVLQTIILLNQSLKKIFHIASPKIAICGLNPHAGEGGTIGQEELTTIIPAIKLARKKRIQALGPFAADTVFNPKISSPYDAIVAMYHDQGLIPAKTLGLNQLVNLTIGLPIIRTSPAHGTAFDIAGKNQADPSSMIAAINMAHTLSL